MPSKLLILCHVLLLPSVFLNIRVFSNESIIHIDGQSIGDSALASVLPVNILGWEYTTLMYFFPNFEPVSCSISWSNCCSFAHIPASQETGKVVCYTHIFKNFPQIVVIDTFKDFNIVNETVVGVFLEFPCFLHNWINVGNLISGSSACLKPSLYI